MNRIGLKKKFLYSLLLLGFSFVCFTFYFIYAIQIAPPFVADLSSAGLIRESISANVYRCNDSWLRKSSTGIWELSVRGSDFELGAKTGILSRELIQYQEEAFVNEIYKMIPSENYLSFLKYFIAWFNKDMDHFIPLALQREIYGISLAASEDYSFIAPNYQRILNYHGAHDIGHAMQNMNMVACTALASWGDRSKDGEVLIGRNFDFYVGDDFAKNKMISFYHPTEGHAFAMVTWGGMVGVVSGMNEAGLTVTLNAAKSDVPTSAKCPVSLVARLILQHAGSISEAISIAQQHETFVAEIFLIGSAKDGEAVCIEKSTHQTEVFHSPKEDLLAVTNHFQSPAYSKRSLTMENIKESASLYRLHRLEELAQQTTQHTPQTMASILRNRYGKNQQNIGMSNEKAINQFIAHHAIIFQPAKLRIWLSTDHYQMGKMVCYDLANIFS
ncbi:MAG: peptidase C45, partial [Planctomycetes bacterium]|nr:peptidase C45 [Planctomycetota bacterium]